MPHEGDPVDDSTRGAADPFPAAQARPGIPRRVNAWWGRLATEVKVAVLTLIVATLTAVFGSPLWPLAQKAIGEFGKQPGAAPSPSPTQFTSPSEIPGPALSPSATPGGRPSAGVVTAWPPPPTRSSPAAVPPPPPPTGYILAVLPGRAYDLDPGVPAEQRKARPGEPRARVDLVRTRVDTPQEPDRISGVNLEGTNANDPSEYNPLFRLDSARSPRDCAATAATHGGNVDVGSLAAGAGVCVRTRQKSWVLLTVEQPARSTDEGLLVRVRTS